nr:type IV secretory system conjugative DNA transfer family protein [Microvirga tunisiensis]
MLGLVAIFFVWSWNYAAATYLLTRQTNMWKAVVSDGYWSAAFDQATVYWGHPTVMKLVQVSTVALLCEIALLAAIGAAIYFQPWKVKPPKGAARIATLRDLKKAGLLNGVAGYSLLLGRYKGKQVRYSGDSHVYVNGPSRSGKGWSFVFVNAMEWRGSLIATDIKQELFKLTGASRVALGQKVYLFAPGSFESHCWNPLDIISDWPRRSTDLDNLAAAMIPVPDHGEPFWSQTARGLFAGVVGYVLDSKRMEGRRTLRSVARMFSTGQDLAGVMKKILEEEPDLNRFVVDRFNTHISKDAEQRLSFEGHIATALQPWSNDLVAAVTSRSDFDIRELRRKPFTVFIGTPSGDLEAASPIIRLFIQQVHSVLMEQLPGKDEPFKVLMLLDEFYQFGRVPEIVHKTPLVAGYGFKIAVISQNISALDVTYGKATRDMMLGNMDIKLIVASGDEPTSEYVSRSLGRHYVLREGWSSSPGKGGMGLRSNSRSGRFEAEPLIGPDEVFRYDMNKSIVLVRGHNGAVLDKINFYEDEEYIAACNAVWHHRKSLTVPRLNSLEEQPLFDDKSAPKAADEKKGHVPAEQRETAQATSSVSTPNSNPTVAAPEPAAVTAAPAATIVVTAASDTPEPYQVQALEPAKAVTGTTVPEPESVKSDITLPQPATAIEAPEPDPKGGDTIELDSAGVVVAASVHDDEEDDFSLDPPAFGSFEILMQQTNAIALTHPVIARLKRAVEEEASAGLLEPGTDLSTFIRA